MLDTSTRFGRYFALFTLIPALSFVADANNTTSVAEQGNTNRRISLSIADEDQFIQINESLKVTRLGISEAYRDADLERLISFYHPQAHHTVSSVTSRGKEKIKETLSYILKLDARIHLRVESLDVDADGLIVEHGEYDYKVSSAYTMELSSTYRIKWIKEDGRWLIYRYHADEPTWLPSEDTSDSSEQ